ncbi:MAG: hypothetical protein P794_02040 [Epsilonproteobacteria bacterium (ex Lamellibrachia satsuma)]|nr:MAG: hypothetical protein P794_02040 [Epsilonproteobacteria bacterium (ex Lamellibrachia satsuma)]
MKTIGIYICTGKYNIFWKDFFQSSEKYFLNLSEYEKHYFVFTDADKIEFENKKNVHKIYQKQLKWPYITLDRFSIFQKARQQLEEMDYIYFFNGNMLFVDKVGQELLPTASYPLVMVKHPGFFDKERSTYTYETDPKSLASIQIDEGISYFMGGLNGGMTQDYLSLIDTLEKNIKTDKKNNLMAIWHDESHLNRYAIDHQDKIKVLDPSYGYPEDWDLPFSPKIIIRNKNKYGGHDFLRKKNNWFARSIKRLIKW